MRTIPISFAPPASEPELLDDSAAFRCAPVTLPTPCHNAPRSTPRTGKGCCATVFLPQYRDFRNELLFQSSRST